jgi:hypothetical protein
MNQELIDQLRKASCVQGKQKTWISGLSDSQLLEIFHRLQNGETAKSIARHVQKAWGVNPTSSIHALSQGILKFRKRCSHLLEVPAPPPQPISGFSALPDVDYDPGDDLESLDYIARIQRERIIAMIEREKKTGVKNPHMSRELQSLATLQKVILKQKAFDLLHEDPLKARKWAKRQQSLQKKFGVFDDFMNTMTEDERYKLADSLDRFLDMAKQHCETLEVRPDGTYVLHKKATA